MKARKEIVNKPILAAGGIVVRDAPEPLIAIVRLRKNKAWVLPKGKLKPGEDALAAARREVMEETGYDVSAHEYLGAISQAAGDRPKVVQFWRMRTVGGPARKLMHDVKSVQWLPLEKAIATLTHAHEQAFLSHAGPRALQAAERSAREAPAESAEAPAGDEAGRPAARNTLVEAGSREPTFAPARAIMRWMMAALFTIAGVGHFTLPETFLSITPAWVPHPREVILATGALEVAGGVALLTPRLRRLAGVALALYALCVWPANFKHALDPVHLPPLPDSWWYHGPRLALQPVIMWWALFCAAVIDWPFGGKEQA